MQLTRWSPVSSLASLEIDALNRMFQDAFGTEAARSVWVPAVDILENANQDIVLKAELPAMKREDIKITFENNVLTIEGERTFTNAAEGETYHRVERGYGAFRRSFTMPSAVDAARVQASYQDGVLAVTLPRREETRPRQIPVNG